MEAFQARHIIEALRMGIPPENCIQYLTVGRDSEIDALKQRLTSGNSGALLLHANYGSGKTHLLKLIREVSLERGFAVSSVTLDAKSSVRFNRMDQVLGAICRNVEIPSKRGCRGLRPLFDVVCECIEAAKGTSQNGEFWAHLTNQWRWDYSDVLDASAMFLAVRAWATHEESVRDEIEGWLFQPWAYYTQWRRLYWLLVQNLRRYFRDPRSEKQFFVDNVFRFDQGYGQSWAAIRDLHTLSCAVGLKGLVVLFDEFEDIITNLNNIAYEERAFWNLFEFYSGKKFPGLTFFAVTPEFVHKCKFRLITKGKYDYDYSRFEALPAFRMSPLEYDDLVLLADRIVRTHVQAYGWEPNQMAVTTAVKSLVREVMSVPVEDRARHTIKAVVKYLDDVLEESE